MGEVAVSGGGSPAGGDFEGAAKRSQRWSREDRLTFFDHFAISGDVAKAAAAAGKTARSAYALRRRSTSFGEQWRLALDDAYERMEAALVRQVLGDTDTKLDVSAALLRQVLGDTDTKLDVSAALLLLGRRPPAVIDVATTPRKVADRNSPRAKAERELLQRLQAISKRSRTKAAE